MYRNKVKELGRKLRLGVIGGGPGSFIGPIHRSAALMHEQFEIVASVLSSHGERSVTAGQELGIPRPYATADELFDYENQTSDPIDVLAILTPNNSHYDLSVRALTAGFHVVCEKPLTNSLQEAYDLQKQVAAAGKFYYVAYAYACYAMVRQARAMMESGILGDLRMVQCEYVQGHLAELTDAEKQGKNWHMDPAIAGPSLILGDIATHAWHLASFVTGQQPVEISAEVDSVVPGRKADDYCAILSRYRSGAKGLFWVTQAGAGAVHGLRIRVFGSLGSVEWVQEQPNELSYRPIHKPAQVFTKGGAGLLPPATYASHVAIGHPEGYREAFANLYLDLSENIVAEKMGTEVNPYATWSPQIADGVAGVAFVTTSIQSATHQGRWEALPISEP